MSHTSIFSFNKEGNIIDENTFDNSWFSAPRVWDALGKKYVRGYRYALIDWDKLNETLRTTKIEEFEVITYLSTCDNVLVKREDFQQVVDAFRKFEVEDPQPSDCGSSIGEQADYIEHLLNDEPEVEYIGWNQTSVNGDDWYTPDKPEGFDDWSEEEQEAFWDDPPSYNILTMHRHWFMFEED